MNMISKRYHYVINLGIVSNFYISIDPIYPGSCARGFDVVGEPKGIWFFLSPYILEPILQDKFWQDIIRTILIQSLCVLFPPSLSILSIMQLKSSSIILLSFPSLLFFIKLCSPSKKFLLASCSPVLNPEGANIENFVIRGSNLPVLNQCQPQWHLLAPNDARQAILICEYLQEKKNMGPNQLFLMWCIWPWLLWT